MDVRVKLEITWRRPAGPSPATGTLTRPGRDGPGAGRQGSRGTRLFCCRALFIIHLIWKTDCEATAQLSASNKAQTQIIHEQAKEMAAERGGKIISERRQRDSSWQGPKIKKKKNKHVRARRRHLSGHSVVMWSSFWVTAGQWPSCNCGSEPEKYLCQIYQKTWSNFMTIENFGRSGSTWEPADCVLLKWFNWYLSYIKHKQHKYSHAQSTQNTLFKLLPPRLLNKSVLLASSETDLFVYILDWPFLHSKLHIPINKSLLKYVGYI